jgi:hypothetical protein
MLRQDAVELEECQAALKRLLSSDALSGSRRLTDLCSYLGNAALEGRSEIGQYEIAEKVLGRATGFNPWDDAAVRKLASQLRYKLEEHYAGPGAKDPVVISLPRRSYILRFRPRESAVPAPVFSEPPALPAAAPEADVDIVQAQPASPPTAARRPFPWRVTAVLSAVALIVAAAAVALYRGPAFPARATSEDIAMPSIAIDTARGDLRGRDFDITPGAVRIGPAVGEGEESSVRLRFIPHHATQQAGLMAMYDADNYVRVGAHFKNRTLLEFGYEQDGSYQGPQSTYAFDPLGQVGQPRWFALRRSGAGYSAYLSQDGFTWTPFGTPLTLPDTSGDLHSAVYAFNGRSADTSQRAVFDHFGVGLAFHNRPDGPFEPGRFPGWTARQECESSMAAAIADGVLRVTFPAEAIGCTWDLMRTPPPGDWAVSALVDFEASSGSSFGVTVRGSKSSTSLTRRDLDGRSLQLEQSNDRDIRIPDFPGSPPVLLRLEKTGGTIRAAVSRDLNRLTVLPGEVRVEDLGDLRSVGLTAGVAHWTARESRAPARIYWVRLEAVAPAVLTKRNVP